MYLLQNIEEAGAAVREGREALGRTQAQLAAEAGLTRARLSLIERGKANMSLGSFLRLVQALGLQLVLEPASERPTLNQLRRTTGQDRP
jgi:transcriptional regulator with XRE-family HTH domain